MKSNKQRRREIREARARRKQRRAESANWPTGLTPPGSLAVNRTNLAPYNSYGDPPFVERGWYEDQHFTCRDCGAEQIWTAAQQRWWYEVCKGQVFSTAVRCRACRLNKRIRDGRERPSTDRAATQTGA